MANVMTQQGDVIILETLDGDDSPGTMQVKLFQNDHTPVVTDDEGDYTVATFSGYSSTSPDLAWGAGFVNGDGKGEIDATQKTWTHNGGGTNNTIYGAYVTTDDDRLIWAERFPAPIVMNANGLQILYTAKLTGVQE